MTKDEALKLALEALESCDAAHITDGGRQWYDEKLVDKAITAIEEALAQPEQEPVVMKFKIYKPTVPDPMRQGINNALLPWVYDQDRSSGFDATMWVTPVATLPPQRKPLTDEEFRAILRSLFRQQGWDGDGWDLALKEAIEAAHGIKGEA